MSQINTLDVRGLRKAYKGRTVVQDVTMHIESGEVVGLLGPNGAGKTTSFYMIVGLVRSDAGEILMDGKNLARMPIHQRARLGLSYLPQEASVFRRLSVADNIRAILQLQRDDQGQPLDATAIETRLSTLLEDLQITHLRNNMAVSLSGGERRRVEIARALATSPRFILLDEPFAGVDPIAVIEIQRIVRFLKERQIGVLITDHNVRETLGICDRAYIISEGSALASGVPQEIIANASVRKVYLGEHFRM
ncbi:MAG: LPS export ABC transporter ATP-binding protein [Burkholderiaceae bacterium]|nr:LPS export ABC transporter ATP-binding protein [Burkholderiaceae bacterium]